MVFVVGFAVRPADASDSVAARNNIGSFMASRRMEHELQRVSEASSGQSINVAGYRQIAIAISRRWIRKGMENGVDDHNDGDWLQDDPLGDIARPIPHTLPEPYTQEIHKSWQVRRQVDDSSFEQLALIGIVF
jgi:hypothetical protein